MPLIRDRHVRRLHFAERGDPCSDRPPVVLIHGAGGSSAMWMMVMARLARRAHTVAIDLPGHGPSDASTEPVTLMTHRDAVGDLGAALGLGRSVLVGHSMGALVAVMAAAAWPDKVAGLVLVAAAPVLPVTDELVSVVRDRYGQFPAWLAERAISPAAGPTLRRAFVAAGVAVPRDVALADFLACRGVDVGNALALVAAPILWLDGADDRVVQIPGGRMPDRPGTVQTLSEVGHMIPIEAPGAVSDAVSTLLS